MHNKLMTVVLIAFLLAGCSPFRITHSWIKENLTGARYDKIMVVGLMLNNERGLREKMENHLAGDLTEKGYTAITSWKEYGPQSFQNMTGQEAVARLRNSGVDAVVTIVLLDKKRERHYVPGRVMYSPYSVYQNHFWGYYSVIFDRVYSSGYYQAETSYFWESNFYDLKTGELLYTVQTKSFEPASVENDAHAYGKRIVGDMVKKGILK